MIVVKDITMQELWALDLEDLAIHPEILRFPHDTTVSYVTLCDGYIYHLGLVGRRVQHFTRVRVPHGHPEEAPSELLEPLFSEAMMEELL